MRRLIDRVASRRGAALTAALGLALLLPGLLLPVMTVIRLGEAERYSVLASIAAVAEHGNAWLAAVLVLFSVVLPTLKLLTTVLIGIGVDRLPAGPRRQLGAACHRFGKYSMLDVFVIAVFIVAFKIQGIVSAELDYGFYVFMGAILVSILSSAMLVSVMPETEAAMVESANPPQRGARPAAGVPRWHWLALAAALVGLGLGLGLALTAPGGEVDRILVEKRPGVDLKIVSLPDAPDYLIEVRFKDGPTYRTETLTDTPIGNGIVFRVPAIELDEIAELALLDDNSLDLSDLKLRVLPDEIVDRVRVEGERVLVGERMRFELGGARAPQLTAAYVVAIVAGLALIGCVGLLVWRLARAREA